MTLIILYIVFFIFNLVVVIWHFMEMRKLKQKHQFIHQFYTEKMESEMNINATFTNRERFSGFQKIQNKLDIIKKQVQLLQQIAS